MKEIHLEDYPGLKEELDNTEPGEAITLVENEESRYMVIPSSVFEELEQISEMMANPEIPQGPNVKVITPQGLPELSYDEYEKVKKQIIKALDENFKPNPEKLN